MKRCWLICLKCGTVDVSKYAHAGTQTSMRCEDCSTEQSVGHATLCRRCCPTEHGTICNWEEE